MKFDIADDAHAGRAQGEHGIAYIWSCRAAGTASKEQLVAITVAQGQEAASRQCPPTLGNCIFVEKCRDFPNTGLAHADSWGRMPGRFAVSSLSKFSSS